MKYLTIGKIINTHGIKGELRIQSSTDFDRYKVGNKLSIFTREGTVELTVARHRVHKNLDLVTFEEFNNINDVEKFKGSYIKIREDLLEELPEDEFYLYKLIGLDVFNQYDNFVGKVFEIRELPQGQIIVIKNEGIKSMIPFNDTFVLDISDKIVINEIEGLINED